MKHLPTFLGGSGGSNNGSGWVRPRGLEGEHFGRTRPDTAGHISKRVSALKSERLGAVSGWPRHSEQLIFIKAEDHNPDTDPPPDTVHKVSQGYSTPCVHPTLTGPRRPREHQFRLSVRH